MGLEGIPLKDNSATAAVEKALTEAKARQAKTEGIERVELKYAATMITDVTERRSLEGSINGNKVTFLEIRTQDRRSAYGGPAKEDAFKYEAVVNGEKISPEDAERAWKKYVGHATEEFAGAAEESDQLEKKKAAYKKTLESIGLVA